MTWNELVVSSLAAINEILAAGIVIVATSLLLYNLSRNRHNRVARTSGAVLASVTFAYVVDVFLSLGPDPETAAVAARLQWLGLAFIPSSLFHLSDALLATTGLPSRGRRRAVVRILYGVSLFFFASATLSDWITTPVYVDGTIRMQASFFSLFPLYVVFFVVACAVTYINVGRARNRGLTDSSKRRLGYLQIAILTPAIGIFPYSALLPPNSGDLSLFIQLFVNIANIIVIIMLIFLSYPLSFFGSDVPDRVVKVELLRFLLRGPGTGLWVLGVMIATGRASDILSLPGQDFMPFAVVAVVLLWQWGIHLVLPYLEKRLVYADEDDEQINKLQSLSDRMLTHGDLQQLIAATLEALCDYLRTDRAFVVSLHNGSLDLVEATDSAPPITQDDEEALRELALSADRVTGRSAFQSWQRYQIAPLFSTRANGGDDVRVLIGVLGIAIEQNPVKLIDEQDTDLLYTYVQRIEQTLDDMILQEEIFAALEGLLPQITMTRSRADEVEYRPGHNKPSDNYLPDRDEAYELVRAALRHYWGGPGIARSRLLELTVVKTELATAETSVQALRNVLLQGMERLRPETERTPTSAEWTFYNILDMRFIEGKKVRDVARRMSLSEPDLYRKQRMAIQSLADAILAMEHESLNP